MPSGLANTLVAPGTGETIDWLPSVGFTAITPPFPPQQVESTTRMTWPDGPLTRATPRGVRRLPPEEMTVWLDVGGPSGSTTMTAASGASTVTMRSPDIKVTAPAGSTSIWIARASTSPAIAALGPTWRRGRSGGDRPRRLRRIIGALRRRRDPRALAQARRLLACRGPFHCLDRMWQGAEIHIELLW